MLIFRRNTPKESPPQVRQRQRDHLDAVNDRAHLYFRKFLGHRAAEKIWLTGQHIYDLPARAQYYAQMVAHIEGRLAGQSVTAAQEFLQYKWKPVGITEFICSPHYLNKEKEIYPGVLAAAEELNNGGYVEAIMTGGIGSGKTTLALYTNAYQLYLLSCLRSPHKQFRLDPSSEILLIFQSITKTLAQGVDYQRFRSMIEGSPYFLKYYPFDKHLTTKLVFPNRVEVVPVAGTETAAIGQNVMGGLIDELNYMAVIEKSRVAVDRGTYDQAILVYNSIARRRKSRFMENGKLPGILCLVSSKKYPGQFTDQKVAEAARDPSIFVYDKRVWDIKPEDFGNQGWFSVFSGDMTRKPRILTKTDQIAEEDDPLVVQVPEEFRLEFEKDVINALREIAGVSTLARHPFFLEVDKVHAAFIPRESIFSQPVVDFVTQRLTLLKRNFWNPDVPRFAHCDLSLSGDSAGLVIGTVKGFVSVSSDPKNPAYMPEFWIDGALEIRPPKNCEILLSKVREVIVALKRMGLNIIWVTFDQYQSADSKQILRQQGFITGHQSIDDIPCKPYDFCKTAFYEGRMNVPQHTKLQQEILRLEKDTKTGRVDHIPGGCFTGETRVALANGTCPTFRELAQLSAEDVFYVYAIGSQGLEIAPARHARVTKTVQLIAEVLLDNYQVIRCTPDHLFMTLDGQWIQAQDLTLAIPLMPLYRAVERKGGMGGYERVWCPIQQRQWYTHRLACPAPKGSITHHIDGDKRNNDPRNLVSMTRNGHLSHHGYADWEKKRQVMREGFDQHLQSGGRIRQSVLMKDLWMEGKFERKARANRTSGQTNHRVLRVSLVETQEEVFDLTVPMFENFALASGVFVHNSKDIADALAGVTYGLTMRREIWGLYRIPTLMIPQSVYASVDKLKKPENDPAYQSAESLSHAS